MLTTSHQLTFSHKKFNFTLNFWLCSHPSSKAGPKPL